jgi:hypothetical protein
MPLLYSKNKIDMDPRLELLAKHAKLFFLFAAFCLYALLELSLNLLLIDTYSQPLETVMTQEANFASSLELFGRILSGFGLALALVSFLNPALFNIAGEQESTHQNRINKQGKWIVRPLCFVLIWAIMVPFLRITVEGFVDNTSNDKKLAAVRAIVYKEAYLSNAVQIEGFPEFDDIANDPARKDLFVALIPSLAFFSSGFNSLIESNLEGMANHQLLNRQEKMFLEQAVPKIRAFDSLFNSEYERYKKASSEYFEIANQEKNFALLEQQRIALLNKANDSVNANWQLYIERLKTVENYNKQYTTSTNIRDLYRKHRKRYRSSKCDPSCMDQQQQLFATYMNNLTFEDGTSFGIYLEAEEVSLTKIFKSADSLEFIFERGRKRLIQMAFDLNDESTYETYIASDNARKIAVRSIQESGYAISDDLQLDDNATLREVIAQQYRGKAQAIWAQYIADSSFKFDSPGLGRITFAKQAVVIDASKRMLGQDFYLPIFTPGLSTSEYQKVWLDNQDNISFIKMVTSTASAAAFSPGGAMFELGNDAVTLAVIPPVSIAASLLAIIMLFTKISIYYWRKHKAYFVIAIIAGCVALVLPIASSFMSDKSYHGMMARFSKEIGTIDTFDSVFTQAFGYVLDAETGLYKQYRGIDFVKLVDTALRNSNMGQTSESTSLRRLDDTLTETFNFLPSLLGTGRVVEPFDANITILKQDMNVGAYMGLRLKEQQVESVKMPNFLAQSDLGLLFEQKVFFNPDWESLSIEFLNNANDPQYWIKVANGQLAKQSAKAMLEGRMASYLNSSPKSLKAIIDLAKQNKRNILLLQLEQSDNYRCFVLENIDASMVVNLIQGQYNRYQEITNCRINI